MIDVKALAQQAGIDYVFIAGYSRELVNTATDDELETFAALVLEAAAVECENHQDNEEQEKALKRFCDADKSGDERNAVDRGQHWMCVSTVNASIRNCANAIRAMKPKGDV